jgi:hypothetical protein
MIEDKLWRGSIGLLAFGIAAFVYGKKKRGLRTRKPALTSGAAGGTL